MRVGVATHGPAPDADRPAGGAADVPAEGESLTDGGLTDGGLTDGGLADGLRTPAPVTDGAPRPASAIVARARAPDGSPCGTGSRGGRPGIHHWGRSGPPGTPSDGPGAGSPGAHRDDERGADAPGSGSPA